MLQNNNQMVGAFNNIGKCVGLSGYWDGANLYSGKYWELDNFVDDEAYRKAGIGKLLSDWMQHKAQRLKSDTIMVAAYVNNSAAHRFYF